MDELVRTITDQVMAAAQMALGVCLEPRPHHRSTLGLRRCIPIQFSRQDKTGFFAHAGLVGRIALGNRGHHDRALITIGAAQGDWQERICWRGSGWSARAWIACIHEAVLVLTADYLSPADASGGDNAPPWKNKGPRMKCKKIMRWRCFILHSWRLYSWRKVARLSCGSCQKRKRDGIWRIWNG